MPKKFCFNCGKALSAFTGKIIIRYGAICPDCIYATGIGDLESPGLYSTNDVRALIASLSPLIMAFSPTRIVGSHIQIDENHKTFKIGASIFEYSNLLSFELLEDGETITKGGLGRAVAGGILFGGVGAIVGGVTGGKRSRGVCNSMRIKITLRNCYRASIYITFIFADTKHNNIVYKTAQSSAQECLSLLQIIADSYQSEKSIPSTSQSGFSAAEEIMKFKQLLDAGVITQSEFDNKKKQLLELD